MPTIKEVLEATLEALAASRFPKGGAVYDDLAQVLAQLDASVLAEKLEA